MSDPYECPPSADATNQASHPVPSARTTATRSGRPEEPTGRFEQPAVLDIVEEWGHGSFPASDPPANW